MEKVLEDILPIMDIEHDCILSKLGDVTVVFRADLPEIFTLSDHEYESFHQSWVKAIKVLPKFTVFHKQDWFLESKFQSDFNKEDTSFLNRSSERFFQRTSILGPQLFYHVNQKTSWKKDR